MQQQQSSLFQSNRIKIMIVNSEMKLKPKTMVEMIRNAVPDLVNVNKKVPFTCNFNYRKHYKLHYR